MKEPLTDELLQELLSAPSLKEFAQVHINYAKDLPTLLQQLLTEKGLSRADVVKRAGLNETHGYQIFMGTRGASRDKVLCLAFSMGANLNETNHLLQAAGASQLYCKDRRDAIITYCLNNGCDLQTVEEELYRFGEQTLGNTQG